MKIINYWNKFVRKGLLHPSIKSREWVELGVGWAIYLYRDSKLLLIFFFFLKK